MTVLLICFLAGSSSTAENGITVSCMGFVPVSTIGSSTVQLIDPPGPPSTIRHSTPSSLANEVSVSVQWDPPTETGGRDDLTYTVTISPPAQLSATVLTSTSVTVTAQYNVDYTVSVVATNCAGSSTTVVYNFRIGGCPVLTNPHKWSIWTNHQQIIRIHGNYPV
ncbi:titin-like isoform X3 [Halichondria panicea]|uniref:titin-like isoform X3 n=1 Tax=Halichondria panicea TaxID=6063 RepID=UPI00312BB4E2